MPEAVLRGAARTLGGDGVREILVELDGRTFAPGGLDELLAWLRTLGFELDQRFAKKDSRTADYLLRRRR